MKPIVRWGVMWHSKNKHNGVTEFLICSKGTCLPALFWSRQEARDYIRKVYGYLLQRPDLRAEPYGWRMPRPVKVEIRAITGWNGTEVDDG